MGEKSGKSIFLNPKGTPPVKKCFLSGIAITPIIVIIVVTWFCNTR